MSVFFFQAEDGIRDLVRSRGLGDVYKRQVLCRHSAFDKIYIFDRISIENGEKTHEVRCIVNRLSLIHI